MSGILDLLSGPIGQTIINGVSSSTGQDSSKTSSVLTMALPMLMKAMERNASTPEGAQGLMGALNKHDGGILDNLGGLFGGGVDESVTNEGGQILNHILGDKTSNIEQVISQKSGVDAGSVGNILKTAAPLLMGLLGKQSQQNGVSDSNGLTSLIGGMLGGASSSGSVTKEQNFLEQMLDSDGDGSVIDDVAGMVLNQGGNSSSGGIIGSVLGGLFGKK